MKKVLLLTIIPVLWGMEAFAQLNISGLFGIQFAGNYREKTDTWEDDWAMKVGVSLAFDLTYSIKKYIEIGGGVEIQIPRGFDYNREIKMFFLPIYAVVRGGYEFKYIKPFAIARLGFNFFLGNDDFRGTNKLHPGFFMSFGAGGVIIKYLIVETCYTWNFCGYGPTINSLYRHFDVYIGGRYTFK